MQPLTRRAALGGVIATAGLPLIASAVVAYGAAVRVPLAKSAILMTEDGTLIFLGMSKEAMVCSGSSHMLWWLHRMACRAGGTARATQLEQEARKKGAALAVELRAEQFEEAEITAYLQSQQDGSNDPDL